MALKAGIVGLPNVGKSTLFNAITSSHVEAANYPFASSIWLNPFSFLMDLILLTKSIVLLFIIYSIFIKTIFSLSVFQNFNDYICI